MSLYSRYLYRLILIIRIRNHLMYNQRDKLRQCDTVENLVADANYMSQEVNRFQALLKSAGDKWGGGREITDQVRVLVAVFRILFIR